MLLGFPIDEKPQDPGFVLEHLSHAGAVPHFANLESSSKGNFGGDTNTIRVWSRATHV